ncbi:CYTH domain-containing protein [Anoxybacillus sp. J5B_2022]|uniref:CYTH domain-containing protein n=1 Tax=Anoxybacillus sp. J5B_2022 TaxID=3003246 RepID=UPI002285A5D3|nr:CYTH domain-containing protein [Anoxybacillus sp. J5B_2022]MCZ0756148.1 CYTH domain-containing protein [Anoxybacillus sp. J5B_2022]
MKQEIEIEFKNLLTKDEFLRMKQAFHIDDDAFSYQENHYFDTPSFSLKEKGAALRIRVKQHTHTLTLKQTITEGLLETHEPLTAEEAEMLLKGTSDFPDEMEALLQSLGVIPNSIHYFGTLATYRAEFPYEGGLLVLDHSLYLQTEDYEVEYETVDRVHGKAIFEQLLASMNIPIRPTKNKIKRFYEKKYEEEEQR